MYTHLESQHNMTAPRRMMPYILSIVRPASVLDVGCGLATWIAAAKECGVGDVVGVDGDYVDRSLLKVDAHEFVPLDLTQPFNLKRRFELVISLEVAEHLPESSADGLVDSICRHADVVLFSAANPAQDGGQNHVNCQWPVYWEEKFRTRGYLPYDVVREVFWECAEIEWWYRQNTLLYARPGILPFASKAPLRTIHPDMLMEKMRRLQNLRQQLDEKGAGSPHP